MNSIRVYSNNVARINEEPSYEHWTSDHLAFFAFLPWSDHQSNFLVYSFSISRRIPHSSSFELIKSSRRNVVLWDSIKSNHEWAYTRFTGKRSYEVYFYILWKSSKKLVPILRIKINIVAQRDIHFSLSFSSVCWMAIKNV